MQDFSRNLRFLDHVSSDSNIYMVTLKQLIDWMREPVPIDRIAEVKIKIRVGTKKT